MIIIENGDIFTDDADALVCPVNCVGVMGKGLALEFKRRFPEECRWYEAMCAPSAWASAGFRPGAFHSYGRVGFAATKNDWRNPSTLKWIDLACESIAIGFEFQRAMNSGSTSVAVPALGCGAGSLDWDEVRPIMERWFDGLDIRVYAPVSGRTPR